MYIHELKLGDPHYQNIYDGYKIYEVRVHDQKRQKMKIGDAINFRHNTNKTLPHFRVIIIGKKLFDNFEDAIIDAGVQKLLPNISTVNEAIELYESFPHDEGTYKDGANRYGVVQFKIVRNDDQQTHTISIKNPQMCPTFDMIKDGSKIVEGRKNSLKYQIYKVGDVLVFVFDGEKVVTLITGINKYANIKEYLQKETLQKTLPCVDTIEAGVNIYNMWVSNEEIDSLQKKYGYGFLGIQIFRL